MKIVLNNNYGGYTIEVMELGFPHNTDRTDEQLMKAISLSKKTNLIVVDIPNGVSYTIEEYDGWETIKKYITVSKKDLKNGLNEEQLKLIELVDYIIVL